MSRAVAYIARCPEHGLHGERTECFVCNGPVEQVPMIELSQDPEGQEYAYRIRDSHGNLWPVSSEGEAERLARTSGVWVERALLGTWEPVQ